MLDNITFPQEKGIVISGKSDSDLLTATGKSTTLKTINGTLCNISNILLADSNARKAKKRSKRFIEKHDQNIIDEDMAIAVSFYNLSYKTSPYVTYKIYECPQRQV